MKDKRYGGEPGESHDIWENSSSFGDDCFKKNEEMVFDVMAGMEHGWCDEIKRGVAFKGDTSTFVRAGAFGWTDC